MNPREYVYLIDLPGERVLPPDSGHSQETGESLTTEMPMRTGLRTEIILSISLLLAAALLFAGFLLIKLTEHNLLEQQRAHAARSVQLVAAGIDEPSRASVPDRAPEISVASLNRLQIILGKQTDIIAWRLLDTKMQVLASTAYESFDEFTQISPSVLEPGELYEKIVYESYRLFSNTESQSYIDLSTAALGRQ